LVILDGEKEIEYSGNTRVVIGKFDGVHVGHQKLIREITEKNDDLKSVVFTFKKSSEYLKDAEQRILSEEERHARFESLGVDYLVEYDLNDKNSKEEPESFARNILKGRLHASEIVCGSDLSFGYKGRGNVELLKNLEDELHIKVVVIDKVTYKGQEISSTRIREALRNGDEESANYMLGNK